MSDDFAAYLPHIDVNDGKKRVVNNLKLYLTLVGKFQGRKMTDDLLESMKGDDNAKTIQVAHALRGTAANLSFPVVYEITDNIETLCKAGEDCSLLAEPLNNAMKELDDTIKRLIDFDED